MANVRRKKIADKDEILRFLTSIMRNEELSGKERLDAAMKLGKYIGLESPENEDNPGVVIYDGYKGD